MKKTTFSKKWKSFKKTAPKSLAKLKKPKYFIPIFAIVGALGIVLTSAYSIRTQTRIISTANCSPNSSIRCYDGAVPSNGAISFNKTAPNNGSSATGKFYIVGNQIVDPDGKIFLPVGANGGAAPGWTFGLHGKFNGKVNEVKGWGWNTIRPNMNCSSNNGLNGDSNRPDRNANQRDFYAGIDSLISEYTSQKIVVMLECHEKTGTNPTDISSEEYAFWENIVSKHKNNPYVWYNFMNEPYTGSSQAEIDSWLAVQTKLYDWLRARSPESVFVADLPGWGQAAHTLKSQNGTIRLKQNRCNVLYGWHNYGAVSPDYATNDNEANNKKAQLDMFNYIRDNKIAVVLGEVGDPLTLNEGTAGPPKWNRWGANASFEYGPERNVGIIWWSATGDSNIWITYSLTADRTSPWSVLPNGNNLSASGKKLWDLGKSAHSMQEFTGNISDSNCSSAI